MKNPVVYKIEKGIAIPEPGAGRKKGVSKYPFAQMKVGDSFFVAGKKQEKFHSAMACTRRAQGFRFATRTVEGGIRIWRIK